MPTNRIASSLAYHLKILCLLIGRFCLFYQKIDLNELKIVGWKPVDISKSLINLHQIIANPHAKFIQLQNLNADNDIGSRIMNSYLYLRPRQTNRHFLHCFLVGLASQHHPWVRLTEEKLSLSASRILMPEALHLEHFRQQSVRIAISRKVGLNSEHI